MGIENILVEAGKMDNAVNSDSNGNPSQAATDNANVWDENTGGDGHGIFHHPERGRQQHTTDETDCGPYRTAGGDRRRRCYPGSASPRVLG